MGNAASPHRLVGALLVAVALLFALDARAAVPTTAPDAGERRVALVIGNAAYTHVARLANPGNDAKLIATTLQRLGFTLVGGAVQENVDKAHFDKLVQDFGHAIQGAEVGLFYYAGHGMQVADKNWLVPIDANPTRPQDLDFQMVDADLVLHQMDGAGTRLNIVILDACRNNPFASLGRSAGGGLAQMRAPEGTMVSFATQPGAVATDGTGADGPYALALADAMRQPGLDIFRLFNRVGLSVKKSTSGVQLPWVSSSPIDGDFYFAGGEENEGAAAGAPVLSLATEAAAPATPAAAAVVPRAAPQTAAIAPALPSLRPASVPAPTSPAPTSPAPTSPAAPTSVDAQINLGLAYLRGDGVAKDPAAALHWLGLAAATHAPRAQYFLGATSELGVATPRNYAIALQWYRLAADQGYPAAEAAVARFYARGLGIARDPAQRNVWFRRAADHGNPFAEFAWGMICRNGDGVPKDEVAARRWFQAAADQGFVLAELQLGNALQHGLGGPRDDAQALRWFRAAAEKGNPNAMTAVGYHYRRGDAVPRDYAEAMRWFQAAAAKGNALAAFNIGLLYADGLGVPRDTVQARQWFEQAATAGNPDAATRLARMDAPPPRPLPPLRPPGTRMKR